MLMQFTCSRHRQVVSLQVAAHGYRLKAGTTVSLSKCQVHLKYRYLKPCVIICGMQPDMICLHGCRHALRLDSLQSSDHEDRLSPFCMFTHGMAFSHLGISDAPALQLAHISIRHNCHLSICIMQLTCVIHRTTGQTRCRPVCYIARHTCRSAIGLSRVPP